MYKRALKGSPTRDAFKHWHKQSPIPRAFYATDLDFIFVRKHPPGIAAILDYKTSRDRVTFAECIAYNALVEHYPVYIVVSEEPFENFEISQFLGGDWKPEPPKITYGPVCRLASVQEFIQWESKIRR